MEIRTKAGWLQQKKFQKKKNFFFVNKIKINEKLKLLQQQAEEIFSIYLFFFFW